MSRFRDVTSAVGLRGSTAAVARVLGLAWLLAAVACTPAAPPPTAPGGSASLTVTLSGVASNRGKILAAVCDQATFLKRCAYNVMEPAAPSVLLRFPQLAPGTYAVMVFHDENNNLSFDSSANGLPLEGFGFSRNAKGRFGPPTFEDAMVVLKPGAATLSIALVY